MKDKIIQKGLAPSGHKSAHYDATLDVAWKEERKGSGQYLSVEFATPRTGETVFLKFDATIEPLAAAEFSSLPASPTRWDYDDHFVYFDDPVELRQELRLAVARPSTSLITVNAVFYFQQFPRRKYPQTTLVSLKARK